MPRTLCIVNSQWQHISKELLYGGLTVYWHFGQKYMEVYRFLFTNNLFNLEIL